jgi:hypothetical protein
MSWKHYVVSSANSYSGGWKKPANVVYDWFGGGGPWKLGQLPARMPSGGGGGICARDGLTVTAARSTARIETTRRLPACLEDSSRAAVTVIFSNEINSWEPLRFQTCFEYPRMLRLLLATARSSMKSYGRARERNTAPGHSHSEALWMAPAPAAFTAFTFKTNGGSCRL